MIVKPATLRATEIRPLLGCTNKRLLGMMRTGRFPAPCPVLSSRSVRIWNVAAVDAWTRAHLGVRLVFKPNGNGGWNMETEPCDG